MAALPSEPSPRRTLLLLPDLTAAVSASLLPAAVYLFSLPACAACIHLGLMLTCPSVCLSVVCRCVRCQKNAMKCMKACKDASKEKRREGRELCFVVFVMIALVSGMLAFFATVMA